MARIAEDEYEYDDEHDVEQDDEITEERSSYWQRSAGPWHALLLLLPLIVLYELGSLWYLHDPEANTLRVIEAERLFRDFFDIFGAATLYLPGIALATVLLIWHILSKESWRIHWTTLPAMVAESAAWTIPLVVLGAVEANAVAAVGFDALVQATSEGTGSLTTLPWQSRLTISIGAGLYEEMLFRLVGIALLHFIFADILRLQNLFATGLSVLLSAVAFALYHQAVFDGQSIRWSEFAFFTVAGVYLGTIYATRGFGIAVATHILYDVLVLVLLPSVEGTV